MLDAFMKKHHLHEAFRDVANQYYVPLAQRLLEQKSIRAKYQASPFFIGVNGCQGSGKSTLSDFIGDYIQHNSSYTVAILSLDDFYFDVEARTQLAQSVHPLLQTRGVPGTHNTQHIKEVLDALKHQKNNVVLPRFNKATDNPHKNDLWHTLNQPADIILFEGWCWGVPPQSKKNLQEPVNALELAEDEKGIWRAYVNSQLENRYADLYSYMDRWIFLQAPSFNSVYKWRLEQEEKLALATQLATINNSEHSTENDNAGVMSATQISDFIQYYQRLTEHSLQTMPAIAHTIIKLNENRNITDVIYKNRTASVNKNLREEVLGKTPLIFSDLDGTLLDHYTYDFNDAIPTITALSEHGFPIIFNTSKTQAEVAHIRADFNFSHPFIIENGAAVYIPKDYFPQMPTDCVLAGEYWVKSFCHNRSHWVDMLNNHAHQFRSEYQGFSQLSINELSELTGLTHEKSEQALNRNYSEPLHWQGDKATKQLFIDYMQELGAFILEGGRFMHVSGYCDKGQAQTWLTALYQQHAPQQQFCTIALGDSGNDIAMLEVADIAVQVRSPVHTFPVLERAYNVLKTRNYGPAGWSEALNSILNLSNK